MAAYTSTQSGNWSAAATWGGSGVPGDGDTAAIAANHAITVDANVTVGSSPATGGTAAVTLVNAATLAVAAGVTLRLRGDLTQSPAYHGSNAVTLAAGAQIVFDPPNAATQYKWTLTVVSGCSIVRCNGTAGSRCAIRTDFTRAGGSGLAAYLSSPTAAALGGLLTATYTDFTNLGTASIPGLPIIFGPVYGTATPDITITDCTFTACSFATSSAGSTGAYAWDGNFTFARNRFVASVPVPLNGSSSVAAFDCTFEPVSGTRTITNNSFDGGVTCASPRGFVFTNNVVGGYMNYKGGTWPTAAAWKNNLIVAGTDPIFQARGNIQDCYFLETSFRAGNPHHVNVGLSVAAITGCLFDHTGWDPNGDCLFPGATFAVTRCHVLPNAAGLSSGKLVSNLQDSGGYVTVEHNTGCCDSNEHGLVGLDETSSTYAGEIPSCRSNIVWANAPVGSGVFAVCSGGSGTPATDAVTVAGYNAFHNPNTGTIRVGGVDVPNTVGYQNIRVTNASQVGVGDLTADPQFVDKTRSLATFDRDYLGNTPAAWANGTSYAVGDTAGNTVAGIYFGRTVNYRCIQAHTADAADARFLAPGSWKARVQHLYPSGTWSSGNAALFIPTTAPRTGVTVSFAYNASAATIATAVQTALQAAFPGITVSASGAATLAGASSSSPLVLTGSQAFGMPSTGNGHSAGGAQGGILRLDWSLYWELASLQSLRAGTVRTYDPATRQATVPDLVTWVKAGFAPQNPALKAAHDSAVGGWIGAVAGPLSAAGAGPRRVGVGLSLGI